MPAPLDLAVGMGASTRTQGETPGEGKTQQLSGTTSALTVSHDTARAVREVRRLAAAAKAIRAALARHGLQSQVRFRLTDRGLVVALISDDVFFDSASATIRPRGQQVLDAVGPVLRTMPESIAV